DALLAGDRLLDALARPRVRPGPLPANRQPAPMPRPAIAVNVSQAGDVLLDVPAELTFGLVVLIQDGIDAGDVVVREIARLRLRIEPEGEAQLDRLRAPHAVEVLQRHEGRLVVR